MTKLFDRVLDFTLKWEGGDKLHNVSGDPGGWTKYGIAQKYHPAVDVPNLTLEQAKEIYRRWYWNPSGCESLYGALAAAVFDSAVNCGVTRALRFLRTAKENHLTRTTVPTWLLVLYERMDHYHKVINYNPAKTKFYKGWSNRVDALKEFCRELAKEDDEEEVTPVP